MLNMFTRSEKEAPLTHEEMDTNLNNISSAVKTFGEASPANNYSPIIGYQVCELRGGVEEYILVKYNVIGKGDFQATHIVNVSEEGIIYSFRIASEAEDTEGEPANVYIQFLDGNIAEIKLEFALEVQEKYFATVQKFTRAQMSMIDEDAVLFAPALP